MGLSGNGAKREWAFSGARSRRRICSRGTCSSGHGADVGTALGRPLPAGAKGRARRGLQVLVVVEDLVQQREVVHQRHKVAARPREITIDAEAAGPSNGAGGDEI